MSREAREKHPGRATRAAGATHPTQHPQPTTPGHAYIGREEEEESPSPTIKHHQEDRQMDQDQGKGPGARAETEGGGARAGNTPPGPTCDTPADLWDNAQGSQRVFVSPSAVAGGSRGVPRTESRGLLQVEVLAPPVPPRSSALTTPTVAPARSQGRSESSQPPEVGDLPPTVQESLDAASRDLVDCETADEWFSENMGSMLTAGARLALSGRDPAFRSMFFGKLMDRDRELESSRIKAKGNVLGKALEANAGQQSLMEAAKKVQEMTPGQMEAALRAHGIQP